MKRNFRKPKFDVKPMATPIFDMLPSELQAMMVSLGYKINKKGASK